MFSNINILALSLLTATALAAPKQVVGVSNGLNDPAYSWNVTQWEAGCYHDGCSYYFYISGPAYHDIPAFSARCTGDDKYSKPCVINDALPGNRGVAAHLLEAEVGTGAHIEVSFKWSLLDKPSISYNYTGDATTFYNQAVARPQNFTITPSKAYGTV